MLKLIPRENTFTSKSKPGKIKPHILVIPKLQQKLSQESKHEGHIIKSAYLRLVNYIKKSENHGLEEMGELIHSLQRSVTSLERKRTRILRVQRKHKK